MPQKNKIFFIFFFLILTCIPSFATVKKADLAGSWYSASANSLKAELNSYLAKAKPAPIKGRIIALISPHAGFVYSGPVAAYGFKAIETQDIETVIVVGLSHRRYYDGIAVLYEDAIQTPLGRTNIDGDITEALINANPKIYNNPIAFVEENSVEMEIPFLQLTLGKFEVVLVAIGFQSYENCRILAEALYDVLKDKKNFLIVGSSDMSHYLRYETANRVDKNTISIIKEFDADKLYRESLAKGHRLMCGYGAVCATMMASKKLGADKMQILKYANSGDTMGDKRRVVGYLSAAMVKSEIRSPKSGTNPKSEIQNLKQGEKNMLNKEQRKKLLKLARDSITYYLKNGKKLPVTDGDPVLNQETGAFVTLHEGGQLRGCIGNMVGKGPLYLTVRDMAVEAATGDPRFRAVTLDEMKDIDIEISVLSPMKKIDDPKTIVMGKHGVMVINGFAQGVYLPQVATETGWNREEFMNSLCGHKAGMAPDAWKKGECDIYVFTAEVFGEKE